MLTVKKFTSKLAFQIYIFNIKVKGSRKCDIDCKEAWSAVRTSAGKVPSDCRLYSVFSITIAAVSTQAFV